MLTSNRYEQDTIEVERTTTGEPGPDGVPETGTETVLACDGDAQSLALDAEATPAVFENGGLRFYASESVLGLKPGDDATVTLEEGRTIEATVEGIELDGDAILLSYGSA